MTFGPWPQTPGRVWSRTTFPLLSERMDHLHDELVAAMRGDVAAVESLPIKSYGPRATS